MLIAKFTFGKQNKGHILKKKSSERLGSVNPKIESHPYLLATFMKGKCILRQTTMYQQCSSDSDHIQITMSTFSIITSALLFGEMYFYLLRSVVGHRPLQRRPMDFWFASSFLLFSM